MLTYAIDNPNPCTINVISGDRDFAYALSMLKVRHYQMVLVTLPNAHESLTAQASHRVDWSSTIQNLRKRSNSSSLTPSSVRSFQYSGHPIALWNPQAPSFEPCAKSTLETVCDFELKADTFLQSANTSGLQTTQTEGGKRQNNDYEKPFTPEPVDNFSIDDGKPADRALPDGVSPSSITPHYAGGYPASTLPSPREPSMVPLPASPDSRSRSLSFQTLLAEPTEDGKKRTSLSWKPGDIGIMSTSIVVGRSPSAAAEEGVAAPEGKDVRLAAALESAWINPNPHEELPSSNGAETKIIAPLDPVAPPQREVPPQFVKLVQVLQAHRNRGNIRPSRSDIALEISNGGMTYYAAGVSTFKQYVELAEQQGVVQLGFKKERPWIGLRPEWYDVIPTIPLEFINLVQALQIFQQDGIIRAMYSQVGEHLPKDDYQKVGVVKFGQYIELAVAQGIVTVGGKGGRQWISLKMKWRNAVAPF